MSESKKDTIYIDVEEELASIIDRLASSTTKVVAMVPPNKNSVLKSVVNLKLIQKAADGGGKLLVIVTSDKSLVRLCGAVGMHVSDDLKSKPYIPKFEKAEAKEMMIDDSGDAVVEDTKTEAEVAADEALTPELAEGTEAVAAAEAAEEVAKKGGKKGDHKLKVPNFAKFRTRFFLLGLPILLIPGLIYYVFNILPKASVNIKSEITTVATDINVEFVASLKEEKLDQKLVSAEYKEIKKPVDITFDATGSKDLSSKAKGPVDIVNCTNSDVKVLAGTAFSVGDKNYFSSSAVTVVASTFQYGVCKKDGVATVNANAQNNGDTYNSGAVTLAVADAPSGVTASSDGFTGGISKTVKVVTQADIDAAKTKAATDDAKDKLAELKKQFAAEILVLDETFVADTPAPAVAPALGEESESGKAKLTGVYTYSVMGVKKASLSTVLDNAQKADTPAGQAISDNGLTSIVYKLVDKKKTTDFVLQLKTTASAGLKLDPKDVANEIAKKPSGDVQRILESKPGVTSVEIKVAPSFIGNLPKAEKIKVNISTTESTNK